MDSSMNAMTKTRYSSSSTAAHKSARVARPSILHLCADLEPGDLARETVDLATLLQRSGWRAAIASAGGHLVTEAERAAVRHKRAPLDRHGWFSDWHKRLALETIIQKERPALLHVHGPETLPFAYALARIHRLPLLVDLAHPLPDNLRIRNLIKNLSALSSSIRVPSEFMGHHLLDVFGIAPERIYHVPPGLDLQWYSASSISAERLQKLSRLWRLPEQAFIVLVPLPLHSGFGHQQFLEAMTRLKNENIFAVMVGTDKHTPGMRAMLENAVQRLGLSGKVVMPEYGLDWPAALWLSNAVVVPNIAPRGQSRAMLAAQALGRPLIATDVGANREMTRGGETAWMIPPDNVDALVGALREALHLTTDQRINLGDNTRDFIVEAFPQAAWFEGITSIYNTLLTANAHAPHAKIRAA
jgi:glycosyltransferase involved in cell wall biosynthesis